METPGTLTVSAHAKLNLALSVGPPRPPKGYHPIASWFVAIDLADSITLTKLADGSASRHSVEWVPDAPRPSPIDWRIEDDLAVRAHRAMETHAGRALPVRLEVRKRIPVGGGLGGGSSDAAAVLVGLNTLMGLGLSRAELRAIGERLGSDVGFFIDDEEREAPRAALVTGFGETIERTPVPKQNVLLFLPPFGCPTGAVYKAFDAEPGRGLDEARVRAIIEEANTPGRRINPYALFNDLALPACAAEPQLATALASLRRALGANNPVHVTGSGSTLFTLIDPRGPRKVLERARLYRPDIHTVETRILGSEPT